jgi:hypothetical protein
MSVGPQNEDETPRCRRDKTKMTEPVAYTENMFGMGYYGQS